MAVAPPAAEGGLGLEGVAIQLGALGLTLAIELALMALLAPRGRRREVLLTLLFANLLTHPLASSGVGIALEHWLVVELAVCAFEALALRVVGGLSWIRAGLLSLVVNASSAGVGLLLG